MDLQPGNVLSSPLHYEAPLCRSIFIILFFLGRVQLGNNVVFVQVRVFHVQQLSITATNDPATRMMDMMLIQRLLFCSTFMLFSPVSGIVLQSLRGVCIFKAKVFLKFLFYGFWQEGLAKDDQKRGESVCSLWRLIPGRKKKPSGKFHFTEFSQKMFV